MVSTTQTAERAYDAGGGLPARVQVSHQVGAGGWLDWLPQETILFQGAALQRHSEINLAKDAGCLLLEAVVLGRAAMGETVTRLQFHDRRIIRRQGRVMWIEPLRLDDAVLAGSDHPALLAGARALASLVMVGPNLGMCWAHCGLCWMSRVCRRRRRSLRGGWWFGFWPPMAGRCAVRFCACLRCCAKRRRRAFGRCNQRGCHEPDPTRT